MVNFALTIRPPVVCMTAVEMSTSAAGSIPATFAFQAGAVPIGVGRGIPFSFSRFGVPTQFLAPLQLSKLKEGIAGIGRDVRGMYLDASYFLATNQTLLPTISACIGGGMLAAMGTLWAGVPAVSSGIAGFFGGVRKTDPGTPDDASALEEIVRSIETPEEMSEFLSGKIFLSRFPNAAEEAAQYSNLLSGESLVFPELPFEHGILKRAMGLYEARLLSIADSVGDYSDLKPAFDESSLDEYSQKMASLKSALKAEEDEDSEGISSYTRAQVRYALSGRGGLSCGSERISSLVSEIMETAVWRIQNLHAGREKIFELADEIGGSMLVQRAREVLEGNFPLERVILPDDFEDVNSAAGECDVEGEKDDDFSDLEFEDDEFNPDELRDMIREHMSRTIAVAREIFPEIGVIMDDKFYGRHPLTWEDIGESTTADYKLARDFIYRKYFTPHPLYTALTPWERRRAVRLVNDMLYPGGDTRVENFTDAQNCLRRFIENDTATFARAYRELSHEDKAIIVHSYFGLFFYRPAATHGQAREIADVFGKAGLFREVSSATHIQNGDAVYYVALGDTQYSHCLDERDIITDHSHPRVYEGAPMFDLDAETYDRQMHVYISSDGDVSDDVVSYIQLRDSTQGQVKTSYWDPDTRKMTTWTTLEFGRIRTEIATDDETGRIIMERTAGVEPDVEEEFFRSFEKARQNYNSDEVRRGVQNKLRRLGYEGSLDFDYDVRIARASRAVLDKEFDALEQD